MHATGRYPDWWQGRRFDRPVIGWACGVTGEVVRDTVQRVLVGRSGSEGTGSIPKDALGEIVSARGIPDLLDTIKIKHVSGGQSVIGLKSYLSGREKFQGETLDFVWFDEEPPADIYTEGLTRTNVGAGPVWMTFTPLLGMSEVVRRFLQEKSPDRHVTSMTIDDVDHYSDEERKRIIASYPPHEVEARTKGIPVLGSGRIFPVPEATISCAHREFPTQVAARHRAARFPRWRADRSIPWRRRRSRIRCRDRVRSAPACDSAPKRARSYESCGPPSGV
jgi:phage terminase large subunit-like protein